MEINQQPAYGSLLSEFPQDEINRQEILNTHRYFNNIRRIAVLSLISAGSLFSHSTNLDQDHLTSNIPNHSPIASIASDSKPRLINQTINSHRGKTKSERCEWITDFPSGYYEGEACSDDTLYKIKSSRPKGYNYGEIVVGGILKCGWVKAGVLKTKESSTRNTYCNKIYTPLTKNPYTILKNLNCSPGTCSDGTYKSKLSPDCNHNFYRNYATKNPTPLNLKPRDNSGFSDLIGHQYDYVHYRGTISSNSKMGQAVVVRSNSLGWGIMSAKCIYASDK